MPSVTERSIIKFGDAGLAMTIPKAWASYFRLKPGDKVRVITNGRLVVYPKPLPQSKARKASGHYRR